MDGAPERLRLNPGVGGGRAMGNVEVRLVSEDRALRSAPVQTEVPVVGVRGCTCGEKHVVLNVPPSFLT